MKDDTFMKIELKFCNILKITIWHKPKYGNCIQSEFSVLFVLPRRTNEISGGKNIYMRKKPK